MKILVSVFLAGVATMSASAFQEIPAASAKALRVTRGKSFNEGLVFIDGQYVAPPYVVDRWGTGIRINKIQVTGQVIDWLEFLKTQSDYKVADKPVSAPAPAPVYVRPPSKPTKSADFVSALDDLFNDEEEPVKATPKQMTAYSPSATAASPAASSPKAENPAYAYEGTFTKNDASDALLKRINAARTEIDRILRSGGFICFGESYSRVTGDARTAKKLLKVLPELQKKSETLEEFCAGVRAANLVYLNEVLCEELFKNKIDYRRLQERRMKMEQEEKWSIRQSDLPTPLL